MSTKKTRTFAKFLVNLIPDLEEKAALLIPDALKFYTLIMPRRPRTRSEGGLYLAQQTIDVEKLTTMLGRVVSLGDLANKTQTPGLDYTQDTKNPKLGDWVLYQKHAGVKFSFVIDKSLPVDDDSNRVDLVAVTDTDHIVRLNDHQAEHLVGWVQ